MRIDKYLKVSRLTKRRATAQALCEAGMVKLNDKVVKPSAEVSAGDLLEITMGRKTVRVRIESLREYAGKSDAESMYTLLGEEVREG